MQRIQPQRLVQHDARVAAVAAQQRVQHEQRVALAGVTAEHDDGALVARQRDLGRFGLA